MNSNQEIADGIESIIKNLFSFLRPVDSGISEYLVLHNYEKHPFWFIVIYFSDQNYHKNALQDGICFRVHEFISNDLKETEGFSDIQRCIIFESGKRPTETLDIEKYFNSIVRKQKHLEENSDESDKNLCLSCGHNFDNHQLLCFNEDANSAPDTGWMICPEENCNCFQTWGADYKRDRKHPAN